MDVILGWFIFFAILIIYWLPTILAYRNKKSNILLIGTLNLFLAGTVIVWVILIYLSVKNEPNQIRL